MSDIVIHPDIAEALHAGRPVVALESAVITHGLPREPLALPEPLRTLAPEWNDRAPLNLELARALSKCVRDNRATPALVMLLDGRLRVGVDDHELHRLAADERAAKASSSDLAALLNERLAAGTTVSATVIACALAGIRVFATGGIGGVHREWTACPDVSADLRALASNPVCVVSAGAKSILDLPATLEALHMLSVPVVGYRTRWFPRFHSTGEPGAAGQSSSRSDCLPLNSRVEDAAHAAALCRTHWRTLKQSSGVLLCNPIPREFALDHLEIDLANTEAERLAEQHRIAGPRRTPFLLNELARLTEGRSLRANIALLLNNAALAAQVAGAMSAERR